MNEYRNSHSVRVGPPRNPHASRDFFLPETTVRIAAFTAGFCDKFNNYVDGTQPRFYGIISTLTGLS